MLIPITTIIAICSLFAMVSLVVVILLNHEAIIISDLHSNLLITLILSLVSYLCGAILYPTPVMAIISELTISSSVHGIALS